MRAMLLLPKKRREMKEDYEELAELCKYYLLDDKRGKTFQHTVPRRLPDDFLIDLLSMGASYTTFALGTVICFDDKSALRFYSLAKERVKEIEKENTRVFSQALLDALHPY